MTADQLISSDVSPPSRPATAAERTVELIRSTFAAIEPQAEGMGKLFYATLFSRAPEVRDLFPVNMEVQRSRLLRALVHVVQMVDQPDDLVPFLQQLGRDHRKFGVLSRHYDALGDALITAIATYSGERWTPEVERAWLNAYATVANAMQEAAAAERGPASWMARVVGHRRIGWDLAVVTVETSGSVPYQAGQYVSVETPHRPRLWRYLSPANAPRPDGTIEFHVRAVDDGWVSRAIVAHTQVGETWRVGPPMGRMAVPRNTNRELLMVAGGTGVAPMKALLDEVRQRPSPPRTQVFVGGRTWDDLYDFAALRRLSFSFPWLDVIPVVESESEPSGAEIGTLADVVTRYGAWNDHDALVCGSPAMIRSTVSRMLVAGTPLDQITYDPFTMD